ncbi:MAG: EscN/YscN/HrcN family type III secretion system ATPase, partial [Candidatus Saganbacteria bacterium]|nr:EscN/YscN/HrcN family type III secretion system ATPase [Candidatus Saganbacteria bacterium]
MDLEKYHRIVEKIDLVKVIGKVTQVVGLIIEAQLGGVSIGDVCSIKIEKEGREAFGEVVGFRANRVLLMPLGSTSGISPGAQVLAAGKPLMVKVGPNILGRVLGGLGEPMDGTGPIDTDEERPLDADPPDPVKRPRHTELLR